MSTITHNLTVPGTGRVEVTAAERGQGRPFLLLHGGAGTQSVAAFAGLLSEATDAHVITPTHPGFDGTPRPEALESIGALAATYAALLDTLGLEDVTVVGNSIGGWIAAELALFGSPRVSRVVLVDAVGIDVPGHPVADFFSLTLDQVAELSYHDPDRFRINPAALPPERQALMAGNRAALAVYGGQAPAGELRSRLSGVSIPTLVVWGDSDQIADVGYGRAYAAAIPGATFVLLPSTGHLPHLETPDQMLATLLDFASTTAAAH